jgi:hypothetical protein
VAYDLQDLRNRVRRKLKDNSYNGGDIDNFLNDAQTEIADLFHWPFFQKTVEGALTVDEYTYEQQSDHQLTNHIILIDPDNTTQSRNISKGYLTPDDFFERFPNPGAIPSAWPSYWTEYGDQVYFSCPVDKEYLFRQHYYRLPSDMATDNSTPDLPIDFREALVLGAHYRAEEQRDNYDFSAIVQKKFEDKVNDLIERYSTRQLAVPIIFGGKPNNGDW